MGMYEDFKTDAAMERDGIVLDYGEFRVTVARAGGANKQYLKLLEVKTRPHQRAIQAGLLDNERSMAILREAYAETVVRNWEVRREDQWVQGIEGADGTLLPFTKENVLTTFQNLPDLFQDLMEQAGRGMLFRAALREQAGGNS